mgnify:CR=1 FL=1
MTLTILPDGTLRLDVEAHEHGPLATGLALTKAGGTARVGMIVVVHHAAADHTTTEHEPIR